MPNCKIIQKDYREFLDNLNDNSIDLILTDPPYAISRETGFKDVKNGEKRFAVSMDFGKWDNKEIDLQVFTELAYSKLRKGGTCIIWYDVWKTTNLTTALQNTGFKMIRLIVWNKTNPVPLNSKKIYLSNSREIAVLAVKVGKPTFNSEYDTGDYFEPIPRHNGNRIHPTQKPLSIFKKLIEKHSNQGDLICDPFLGSGTSAVGALELNREFIGCDIDKEYIEKAKERVKQIYEEKAKEGVTQVYEEKQKRLFS